jgi:acetyl esterase/lipase
MKHSSIFWTLALTILTASGGQAADKPLVIPVWPDKAPGEAKDGGEEKLTGEKGSRRLTNVTKPTLTVYRPSKEKDTGAAVLIAPGGGYNFLAWDHEGEDVAAWLNSIGVTGIVFKYRVPRRSNHPTPPLQDAQRAISLVRDKAKEWGIDSQHIGMLGFSAGGHLTAITATNFDRRSYEPRDAADKVSCRPDFAVLIYPGGVVARNSDQLDPNVRVSKEMPPAFFVHCGDDRVAAENSVLMYLAMRKAGVPAEMHLYASGGHGFGMRPSKLPVGEWPKRCEDWLRAQKILKTH